MRTVVTVPSMRTVMLLAVADKKVTGLTAGVTAAEGSEAAPGPTELVAAMV